LSSAFSEAVIVKGARQDRPASFCWKKSQEPPANMPIPQQAAPALFTGLVLTPRRLEYGSQQQIIHPQISPLTSPWESQKYLG